MRLEKPLLSTLYHTLLPLLPNVPLPPETAPKRLAQRLIPPSLRLAHARRDLFQRSFKVFNEHHHAARRVILFRARTQTGAARIHLLECAQRAPERTHARLAQDRRQIGPAVPLATRACDHRRNFVHGGGRGAIGGRGRERDAAPRKERADDLGALVRRGKVDVQEPVEAAWPTHRWVEHVRAVGRGQDEDATAGVEAV
jgi:hypothetical protein